jgi:hypothetical protein
MRKAIIVLMVIAIAGAAIAQDLGNSRELPVKNTPTRTYTPPAEVKQGGDTVFDATVIQGLPYSDTGNTCGYTNDYDEVCPYTGSTSPDVVYSFTPGSDRLIGVDLCGSQYDTKTYIYDSGLNLVACNDDFYFDEVCGVYVSRIENAPLMAGETYFIVIDGFGGDCGDYILTIPYCPPPPCWVTCDADAVAEGEPPLHDGYDDEYNSGCKGDLHIWQPIDWTNDEDGVPPYDGTAWLCGKSGWFIGPSGGDTRDTDWFIAYALETGVMEVTADSEFPCYLFKLAPTDCNEVGVEFQAEADCYAPATLSFPVTAGEEIWLWVGPTNFTGPVTEFTYFMTVSNNTFDVVPNEGMSWGQVKSLYR